MPRHFVRVICTNNFLCSLLHGPTQFSLIAVQLWLRLAGGGHGASRTWHFVSFARAQHLMPHGQGGVPCASRVLRLSRRSTGQSFLQTPWTPCVRITRPCKGGRGDASTVLVSTHIDVD